MTDHIRSRRGPGEFSFQWEPIISPIDKELEKETDPLLREMLYFSKLSIASMKKDDDQSIYKIAIDSIPPPSCIWLLDPSLMYYALTHAGYTNEQRHEYIYNILRCSHERRVKSILLFNMFHLAKYSGQTDYAAEYYDVLTSQFRETHEAQFVKEKFQRDYAFIKGKPIPELSLHSFEDPPRIINNLSLRGKFVLIDFWAQWGPQCIADMSVLHHLYEKYQTSTVYNFKHING